MLAAMKLPKEAWGNALGWTSAGLLVAVVAALLAVLHRTNAMTPPTAFGRDPANYAAVALPLDATRVAGQVRPGNADATADAGAIYRAAADAYLADPRAGRTYEDFAEAADKPAPPGALPLVQTLVDALDARAGTDVKVFGSDPASLVNYDRALPRLEALFALGRAAQRQASLLAARGGPGDLDASRQLFAAAFALGVRLYQERVVYRELQLGYRLAGQSLGGLVALAKKRGDAGRAAELAEQSDAFRAYVNGRLEPAWSALAAIDDVARGDDAADVHAGDVAFVAANESADPMWRTEAILRLGKNRLAAARLGDRAGATRTLRALARSVSDPRLKLAVAQAQKLTEPQRLNAR